MEPTAHRVAVLVAMVTLMSTSTLASDCRFEVTEDGTATDFEAVRGLGG